MRVSIVNVSFRHIEKSSLSGWGSRIGRCRLAVDILLLLCSSTRVYSSWKVSSEEIKNYCICCVSSAIERSVILLLDDIVEMKMKYCEDGSCWMDDVDLQSTSCGHTKHPCCEDNVVFIIQEDKMSFCNLLPDVVGMSSCCRRSVRRKLRLSNMSLRYRHWCSWSYICTRNCRACGRWPVERSVQGVVTQSTSRRWTKDDAASVQNVVTLSTPV